MDQARWASHVGVVEIRSATFGLALVLTAVLVLTPPLALAQLDGPAVGSVVRVANTDGQRLNVRAGPAADQPVVARVPAGETLTVTGLAQTAGMTLWVPVRTVTGQNGWVSAAYVVVLVSGPVVGTPPADVTPASGAESARESPSERVNMSQRDNQQGAAVEVEAKLKFPEVKGREQEITVWVTRDGRPVIGAIVTLESSDGDEGERFRQLDPTDEEGRARRSFDVRHEKGTVELQVEAVAPDGGEGRTIVSYFKR
jgi:uncharacterized protein YraI